MTVTMTINGEDHVVDIAGPESLLTVLRNDIGLPGTKDACEQGECGSCTVEFDGQAVCSCLIMAADADKAGNADKAAQYTTAAETIAGSVISTPWYTETRTVNDAACPFPPPHSRSRRRSLPRSAASRVARRCSPSSSPTTTSTT